MQGLVELDLSYGLSSCKVELDYAQVMCG